MQHVEAPGTIPRLLALGVAIAGIGAIAWQAHLVYSEMELPALLPDVSKAATTPEPQVDTESLQRLFGPARISVPAGAESLPLVLQGCVVSNDPARSHAIVELVGEGARTVFPGDELLPGIHVREIQQDHVVLSRHEQPLTLRMPGAAASMVPAA